MFVESNKRIERIREILTATNILQSNQVTYLLLLSSLQNPLNLPAFIYFIYFYFLHLISNASCRVETTIYTEIILITLFFKDLNYSLLLVNNLVHLSNLSINDMLYFRFFFGLAKYSFLDMCFVGRYKERIFWKIE